MDITKLKLKFNPFRLCVLFITCILIGFLCNYYISNKSQTLTESIYSNFNKKNYKVAYNLYKDSANDILLHKGSIKTDLTNYFTGIVKVICSNLQSDSISDDESLDILLEIQKYNLLGNSLDKLIFSLDASAEISTSTLLSMGIDSYKSKNYVEAIQYLNKISQSDSTSYAEATNYKNKIKTDYKNALFKEADSLIANKYFTKALDLLSNYNKEILDTNDEDLTKKINFITMARDEYLANQHLEDSEYTSNAILETITINNINTLNIESKTPYLIYVNLTTQETNIYKGTMNNWQLQKTISCSTGIEGEETPKGVYSIISRGEWFFSNDYDQGGKYWVQFMGDYLFHSLPFAEDQETIVDTTLGKPASHGCIRLPLEDSKWLYDNIPNDTKLIIN